MYDEQRINRRSLLKTAGAVAGAAALGTAATRATAAEKKAGRKRKPTFKNESFYDQGGEFDVEKGKDAILALCKYHGYPIFPELREKLWVSDYGTGQFTKLGLAACLFINNEKDRYMLMDLFLLPGQMLPEHWHLDGVRWGSSHIVGIGEPNLGKEIVIPKCHMGGKVTTEHEVLATPGMFVPLAEVKTRHWQYGGPEGAIVTEVANVHTDAAVRHSDPAINKQFLGG